MITNETSKLGSNNIQWESGLSAPTKCIQVLICQNKNKQTNLTFRRLGGEWRYGDTEGEEGQLCKGEGQNV